MATFTNQATLSYNGISKTSNTTVGELLEVLSLTKTAVNTTYGSNDRVTYIVSIVNSGTAPFTGLTLTDDLGGYTVGAGTVYPLTYVDGTVRYYTNGTLQTTPTVTAGPPMTITGLTVPAGGNATLVYEARTTEFAPQGTEGSVTNTATLSGGGITPITGSAAIAPALAPTLTISKAMNPTTVTENGQVTYTFVIENTGAAEATATDNVVVTDVFNPILNPITVTLNGTAWTEGTQYTYDATTGTFATVAGQITVPAATYTQDPTIGRYTVTPGVTTLVVTGTI